MKFTLVKKAQNLGFTMIELLIVIAILGILAVAVLSAINPLEQINRGRDTGLRSDAEQLLNAIDRFYAFNGFMPWQGGAADVDNMDIAWGAVSATYPIVTLVAHPDVGCTTVERLSVAPNAPAVPTCQNWSDELKTSYIARILDTNYRGLYIFKGDITPSDSVYVCFAPQSNAFRVEAAARVDAGNLPGDYPAGPGVDSAVSNPSVGAALNCGPAPGHCVCLP